MLFPCGWKVLKLAGYNVQGIFVSPFPFIFHNCCIKAIERLGLCYPGMFWKCAFFLPTLVLQPLEFDFLAQRVEKPDVLWRWEENRSCFEVNFWEEAVLDVFFSWWTEESQIALQLSNCGICRQIRTITEKIDYTTEGTCQIRKDNNLKMTFGKLAAWLSRYLTFVGLLFYVRKFKIPGVHFGWNKNRITALLSILIDDQNKSNSVLVVFIGLWQ